jgi:hypothetical protein
MTYGLDGVSGGGDQSGNKRVLLRVTNAIVHTHSTAQNILVRLLAKPVIG